MLTQRGLAREGRIHYGMAWDRLIAAYRKFPWLEVYVGKGKASHIYVVALEDSLF
jgi:hypothetical protein